MIKNTNMKSIILLTMLVASLTFSGCGKKTAAGSENGNVNAENVKSEGDISEKETLPQDESEQADEGETSNDNRQLPECFKGMNFEEFIEYMDSDGITREAHKKTDYVSKYDGPFEEIHYSENRGEDCIYIYDNRGLVKYYGYETASIEDIKNNLNNNSYLNDSLKEFILDYVEEMLAYYPDLDVRNFCESLKLLEVEYVDDNYFAGRVLANYSFRDNVIHLLKGTTFTEGTPDIINMRHELGHMFSMREFSVFNDQLKMNTIFASFEGVDRYGETESEVLNTFLTTEPFLDRYDNETRGESGYIGSANVFRALLKLIPEDVYVENILKNNVYYFESYLDDYLSGSMTAGELFELYEEYYDDVDAGRDSAALLKMRKIMHFVAENYAEKAINDSMTDDEVDAIRQALKDRLLKYTEDSMAGFYNDAVSEVDKVFDAIN